MERVAIATGLLSIGVTAAVAAACTWDGLLDWVSETACKVLVPVVRKLLVVPKQMYFVMDGNRRWARGRGEETLRGHEAGYRCLQRLLKVLSSLGVEEVTVYAFSIPNFKRSEDEKSYLMSLATEKLKEMASQGDVLEEYDVRVRVVGDMSRLPPELVQAAQEAEHLTQHRTRCTLNIAFAYASRTELEHMAATGRLWISCPTATPPLFVRTSGEHRFSDFLTWQSAFAHLCFQSVLWPDYRAWHLLQALLQYNIKYSNTQRAMDKHKQVLRDRNITLEPNP